MFRRVRQLYGKKLGASDGDIGHLRDFYFNDQQWSICSGCRRHRFMAIGPVVIGHVIDFIMDDTSWAICHLVVGCGDRLLVFPQGDRNLTEAYRPD